MSIPKITNKKRKLEEDMDELVAKADKTANADPDSISLTSRGLGTSLQAQNITEKMENVENCPPAMPLATPSSKQFEKEMKPSAGAGTPIARLGYMITPTMEEFRNQQRRKHGYFCPPRAVIFQKDADAAVGLGPKTSLVICENKKSGPDPVDIEEVNDGFGAMYLNTSGCFYVHYDAEIHNAKYLARPPKVLCLLDAADQSRLEWVRVNNKKFDITAHEERYEPLYGAGERKDPKSPYFIGRTVGEPR